MSRLVFQMQQLQRDVLAAFALHLEPGYALHERVFGIVFLVIVAIPVRRGRRWA